MIRSLAKTQTNFQFAPFKMLYILNLAAISSTLRKAKEERKSQQRVQKLNSTESVLKMTIRLICASFHFGVVPPTNRGRYLSNNTIILWWRRNIVHFCVPD